MASSPRKRHTEWDQRNKKPAGASSTQILMINVWLIGTMLLTTFAAIVQQIRYPESAAWIVAVLGVGFLLLFLAVKQLADRNYLSARKDTDNDLDVPKG